MKDLERPQLIEQIFEVFKKNTKLPEDWYIGKFDFIDELSIEELRDLLKVIKNMVP